MKIKTINALINRIVAPPGRFAGGFILNLLGYHILRVLIFNISFIFRKRMIMKDEDIRNVIEKIEKDGLAVIENFFSEDVFLQIKNEYDQLNIDVVNHRMPHIKRSTINCNKKNQPAPIIEKCLTNNHLINEIVSIASRRKMWITPKIQAEKSFFDKEDLGKPTTDQESNNLHFDVSYPTFKCFLYMTDTDEKNAAFAYIKKSHKMTLARLWMEYKMSVVFWIKNRRNVTPEVSKAFIEKQGMKITPIIGKSNTLIIVNTMGFHRRGDYLTTTPRQVIIMNYRDLDSLRFWWKKLSQKK